MFFFQDDIGILIQLARLPFWTFIFTPVSANFAPLMQLIYSVEYRVFGLQFPLYVVVSVIFHSANCILLYGIAKKLFHSHQLGLLGAVFFSIHVTYTEPLLWLASQGILPATFFLGLGFLFWYQYELKGKTAYIAGSICSTLLSGCTYSLGTGIGVVFGIATYIFPGKLSQKQRYMSSFLYILTGVVAYIIGPLVYEGYSQRVFPAVSHPVQALIQYLSFIVAGVSRGIIGRFFLPGFDPSHKDILPTLLSFFPAVCIGAAFIIFIRHASQKYRYLIYILGMFVMAAYVWPGFIRYHFGLKQALAERYAYHGIFFFCLMLVILVRYALNARYIRYTFLAVATSVLLTVQTFFFLKHAVLFGYRPLQTKQYFSDLRRVLMNETVVVDLPLPSFIRQYYFISDLAPVLMPQTQAVFVKTPEEVCIYRERIIQNRDTMKFYLDLRADPFVVDSTPAAALIDCLIQHRKRV